ncbi:hypothetical protein PSACC_02354 [Paramicrosporidium saccamoebae]|uniref:Uncharacterized protein n=1 Tax=Paramicrosporidium saccamoebae TaxID=1246581 RepID=A0A2H9TJD3_9FUNG|nr:hypothetical protein PSACC_02354 [Paramicrosporidium saccamoebae]
MPLPSWQVPTERPPVIRFYDLSGSSGKVAIHGMLSKPENGIYGITFEIVDQITVKVEIWRRAPPGAASKLSKEEFSRIEEFYQVDTYKALRN